MTRILHGFADRGGEAEALAAYGDVTRATLSPESNHCSAAVVADLSRPDELPFHEDQFALAFLHPPCTAYSSMPSANKHGDAPELIPEAREVGQRYADHYVVENKPTAPLNDATVLDGRMFGLPIQYKRAFETSFPVDQPPRNARLTDAPETSPFYFSERTEQWWRAAKGGIVGDYPKEHIAKNVLPLPFVHHVARAWLDAAGQAQGVADYSNYDDEMDRQRAEDANMSLDAYADGGQTDTDR
jgi:hypothetical protein